jgi:hypothetical protein
MKILRCILWLPVAFLYIGTALDVCILKKQLSGGIESTEILTVVVGTVSLIVAVISIYFSVRILTDRKYWT